MINSVVIVGRLTKDPDLRYLPNGTPNAQFTLAVNRPFKNNGEQQADFINVAVWRKQGENAAQYLKKGSLAGVTGRIQTRSYDNNEGKRVYITEVVADSVQFLEPKGGREGNHSTNQSNSSQSSRREPQTPFDNYPFRNDGQSADIDDDDLPF